MTTELPRRRPAARWVAPSAPAPDLVAALQSALSLPGPLCELLVRRGFSDPGLARRFLRPSLDDLAPPEQLLGMTDAVARLGTALDRGETIFVHGDYDVDGMTSTAILTRVLRGLGGQVVPFVPYRLTDGYDLGPAGVAAAIAAGASLVVTCDCGTSAHAAVDALAAAGIDCIITDHHLPSGPLPKALTVLNPRRPGCPSVDKDLVAAGVVFKLALALCDARGVSRNLALNLLDLVAVATIADVAPLRGENRTFVRFGLRILAQTKVPGLRALVRSAGLDAKELTAGRIGFILAPRLNAAGRIGRAQRGVELLLTDDDATANAIARELEEMNRGRQELDRQTLDAARKQLDGLDLGARFGLVLADQGWHPGVIGIVASRLVEETGRPTIMIAVEDGVGKGSGRSIVQFDLHGALTECRDLFVRFGGHRAAAGITIAAERIPEFTERFAAVAAEQLTGDDLVPELRLDLELPLGEVSDELITMLRHCEPFGVGNPAPVFALRGVAAAAAPRRIGDQGLKLTLTTEAGGAVEAISWDLAPRLKEFAWRAPFDVACRLERDEWKGTARIQARIADLRQ
jgi:single-stranded-DNA-specific exonuclease